MLVQKGNGNGFWITLDLYLLVGCILLFEVVRGTADHDDIASLVVCLLLSRFHVGLQDVAFDSLLFL